MCKQTGKSPAPPVAHGDREILEQFLKWPVGFFKVDSPVADLAVGQGIIHHRFHFLAAMSIPVPENLMSGDRRLGVWLDVLDDSCSFGVAFCYAAGAIRASFKSVRRSLIGIGSLAPGTSVPWLGNGFLPLPLGSRFEERGHLARWTGRVRLANHTAQLGEAFG